MRLVAEGAAGTARICNAGAGFLDTIVAPRDRGGQGDGVVSRVFTATGRPQGTPLRLPGALHRLRAGFPAAGRFLACARIVRLCVYYKRGAKIAELGRIGGENGAGVWKRWDVRGVGWGKAGNG